MRAWRGPDVALTRRRSTASAPDTAASAQPVHSSLHPGDAHAVGYVVKLANPMQVSGALVALKPVKIDLVTQEDIKTQKHTPSV